MRSSKFSVGLTASLVLIAATLLVTGTRAAAQPEKVLHSFGSGRDGNQVNAGLVFDASGNLYGSATGGGMYNLGTVYEVSPQMDGSWAETSIYSFGRPSGGYLPNVGPVFDTVGNLYGTTTAGGAYNFGTVYQLSRSASGEWVEKTLHSFNPAAGDGNSNSVFVVVDAGGNVFGSTTGGAYNDGFIFQLTPTDTGEWTETVLRNFNTVGYGGYFPGNVILDAAGNLYGAASGGPYGGGMVFRLSPSPGGGWTEAILRSFRAKGKGGAQPDHLAFDSSGNLYGLTAGGGDDGLGVAFELIPSAHGQWTEKVLYSFDHREGFGQTGLVIDASGNLYGTMQEGGAQGFGNAFELSPAASGAWTAKILYSFRNNGKDGTTPYNMVLDTAGNLYGTTANGGLYGAGTVFEITP